MHKIPSGWWACAAFLGIGLFGALCWSESSRDEAQSNVAQGQTFSTRDLTIIQERLAQLTDSHRQLLQATEEIKRELAIIKVRVTN
ncbi:MAG: hypothetical protein HYZ89_02170 [Candidatus Omnitrophica bacterium]|nr:hypothetical protein [Candidatus Omnitrophota bacterium]